MKKIIIMMLVAFVPLLTMAQKRSKKKDKDVSTEQTKSSKANVEYMMIKGIEIPREIQSVDVEKNPKDISDGEDVRSEIAMKRLLKPRVRLMVIFDYGNVRNKEVSELMRASRSFGSMTDAANAAAEKGWEFMSANVVSNLETNTYYYYMKRKK